MSWRSGLAALATALLGACASLPEAGKLPPTGATTEAGFAAAAPEPAASTPGAQIQVDAPEALKALLVKHLDLVRLGRISRDEVDDTEWARLIDATPAQVRELLQTEGYFAPVVSLERAPGRAAGEADHVSLKVEPGPRVKVGSLTLEVQGELQEQAALGDGYASKTLAAFKRSWSLPVGSDFRNPDWSGAKASALARLRAAGYISASWAGTGAEVDTEHQSVRIFVVVESGPLFRWGSLQIEGLVAQDAETVANLVNAHKGAPVTESLLLDFQERLQKSGLFENVSVALDPDPDNAAEARITAKVRETPLQVYTFGLGFSANTGQRASVEHLYRRVFGYSASSRIKVELGKLRQAGDGEISTHTYEGLWRYLIGGAVERLESSDDVVLSQRARLGRAQDTTKLERLFFIEAERSLRKTTLGSRDNAFAFTWNFHGGWRDLDSIILPTDGQTLSLQLGIGRSHGTDARPGYYSRTYGRLTVYRPLGSSWYAQTRLELGNVDLRPGMVAPDSQKWRAGGDDSVRGYTYRSLGPLTDGAVGSGTSLFTTSFELAHPISANLPSVWGAVFIDAGAAANGFHNLDPALGTGVGVRWRSPVGPLRIDWAWGRQTHRSRLHFSVGIAF